MELLWVQLRLFDGIQNTATAPTYHHLDESRLAADGRGGDPRRVRARPQAQPRYPRVRRSS
jgi:hypothetical protein